MAQEVDDEIQRYDEMGDVHNVGVDGNVQGANNTAADGAAQGPARKAVADGNIHGVAMRSDTNCKGNPMVSGEEAFPYSLLSVDQITGNSTENQRNHFATTRMI